MIGRGTSVIMAGTLAGAFLGFIALKIFTIETGSAADSLLGSLAFAMGIGGVFSVLTDLSMGTSHIKAVSERRDLAVATGTYAAVKIVICLVFLAAVTLAAFVASSLGVLQDTSLAAIALVGVFLFFVGLRGIFTATFDGRREFVKSQLVALTENAVRPVLMVLVGVAYAAAVLGSGPLVGLVTSQPGLAGFVAGHASELLAAAYAVGGLASFAMGWMLFRRGGYPLGRPDLGVAKDYWRFARPILFAAIAGTIYVNSDKVIITYFWDAAHTGRFFAAQRIGDLLSLVPIAVSGALFPTLSAAIASGDRSRADASMNAALRHISMVVLPLAAFVIALAGPLIALTLTDVFVEAAPTLRLLAVYSVGFALLYPYLSIVQAHGEPGVMARSALIGTLANVGLNLLLVPPAGTFGLPLPGLAERGSAVATVIAILVQFVIMNRAAGRITGSVDLSHLPKQVGAAAVVGGVLWFLAPPLEGASWILMTGLLALAAALYLVMLALMGEFTRKDLDLYLQVANPVAFLRHVGAQVRSTAHRSTEEAQRPGADEGEPRSGDGDGGGGDGGDDGNGGDGRSGGRHGASDPARRSARDDDLPGGRSQR